VHLVSFIRAWQRGLMTTFPTLVRAASQSGETRYSLGHRIDLYLGFVAGRVRPNTLRAVAFDLKTFFAMGNQS
jgi:hypothetical protein